MVVVAWLQRLPAQSMPHPRQRHSSSSKLLQWRILVAPQSRLLARFIASALLSFGAASSSSGLAKSFHRIKLSSKRVACARNILHALLLRQLVRLPFLGTTLGMDLGGAAGLGSTSTRWPCKLHGFHNSSLVCSLNVAIGIAFSDWAFFVQDLGWMCVPALCLTSIRHNQLEW